MTRELRDSRNDVKSKDLHEKAKKNEKKQPHRTNGKERNVVNAKRFIAIANFERTFQRNGTRWVNGKEKSDTLRWRIDVTALVRNTHARKLQWKKKLIFFNKIVSYDNYLLHDKRKSNDGAESNDH